MKKISQLVQQIEQIESDKSLEQFFSSISAIGAYKWSGLMMFVPETASSTSVRYIGNIPQRLVKKLIKEKADLIESCKDQTSIYIENMPNDGWDMDIDLQGIVLVKFDTQSSEFGFLILGVIKHAKAAVREKLQSLSWFWMIIIPYIYKAYRRGSKEATVKLTKRELECMKWASEGKTSWEISQILNISERTVNFHIANYIEKTGSINRQQAIAKCLLQGHLMAA
jgi:DNA-binding CsgD family transcriptional regulator